jgi:hypothetical protein
VKKLGMMVLTGVTALSLIGLLSFIFWHVIALFE